jgi:hypothetical protein
MNEIYNYSSRIFESQEDFMQESINMATHLYQVSTHPNIKKGELYVTYITGGIFDGKSTNIIGVFKSETKDFYLDLEDRKEKYNVHSKKGINTSTLDKGCLIFDFNTKIPQKVFIVDNNSNEALYWKKFFLKVVELEDDYNHTSKIIKNFRKYIKNDIEVEPRERIRLLNSSIKYFQENDKFELNEFAKEVFEKEGNTKRFIKSLQDSVGGSTLQDNFDISTKAVTNLKKTVKNSIRLDSNIEIRFDSKIKSIKNIVEKGYDNNKKMNYYKIYYSNEE